MAGHRCGVRSSIAFLLSWFVLSLFASGAAAWAQDTQNPPPTPEPQNPQTSAPPQETPPQETPPPAKKDEAPNPAQSAAEATKRLGQQTLAKLRDWEIGYLTGPYVGRTRQLKPLTDHERQQVYLQKTLTVPSDYFKRMVVAAWDQMRNSPSQWGQGWGAYGERFASREGQFISANSVAALGDWALKYEPRYDQCRCSGFRHRVEHAILRNFLTYNQTETEMRPQWGLYAGAFSGGVISSTWKPRPRNVLTNGGYAVVGQGAYGSALNLFIEFAGDINRKLGGRRGGAPRKDQ